MAEKQPEAQFSEEAYNTLLLSKINKTLEGHWKWYTINNNKNDDEFTKAELRSILHKIDTQLPSDEKEKPNPPKSEPGKNGGRHGIRNLSEEKGEEDLDKHLQLLEKFSAHGAL